MIDVNQGWDVDETIKVCKEIEKYNPEWIEEPIMADNYDGYNKICKSTKILCIFLSRRKENEKFSKNK